MKKYILSAFAVMAIGANVFAQEAKEEMNAFIKDGLVTWKSADKGVSFRIGGRVAIDGAHYIDDKTDRGSGFNFAEARLRVYSTFADNFDAKFDIDFAGNKVSLKDVYARYHLNSNGMFYVGNFAEPFSASNIQSSADISMIHKSATTDVFGTGRALGISYRHYGNMFWGEAGAFSQQLSSARSAGDKGWSLSTRLLFRYTECENGGFHIGGSFNYRNVDAAGFENGKDDHNRIYNVNSSLESTIDNTNMMNATVHNADKVIKYGAEVMGFWKRFYVQAEYLGSTTTRNKDWEYLFNQQLGGMWSSTTMESFKKFEGDDRNINFNGYYAEAGFMILGGNYSYNKTSALMNRPGAGALEVMFRYNHTDLDDVDGVWFDGNFWNSLTSPSKNNSVSGGIVDSYTVGVNYHVANNLIVKLDYNHQSLDSYQIIDKKLNTVMCRLFFEF